MTNTVIGIRFKKAGKIYYFDPMGADIAQFDHVVVETVQGIEYGEVALGPRVIDANQFPFPVKPILRKATAKDDTDYLMLREKEEAAKDIFDEKVRQRGLDMHLINVEYTFDKKKAIFFFTAEGRVDFRDLVKDLASVFHVRIELRQIGVRDEAKLFHTLGCCGRNTCCSEWLGDFTPVSIKMAKDQNVSLNATKISGVCGRLLCCLTYENDFYKNVTRRMPKIGQMVETPEGVGQVYRLDVLRENVIVKIQNDRDETEIKTFALSDIAKSDVTRPAMDSGNKENEIPQIEKKRNWKQEGKYEAQQEKKADSKVVRSEEKQDGKGQQRRRNKQGNGNERRSGGQPEGKKNQGEKRKSAENKKSENKKASRPNEKHDDGKEKESKNKDYRNHKHNGHRRYGKRSSRNNGKES